MVNKNNRKKIIINSSIKLKLIFFYMIICNSLAFGQSNLKTHKVVNGNESLIYNYYQDANTLQNINHGIYSYTSVSGQDKTVIKGHYSNGLKDGVWTWDVVFYNKYYGRNFDKVTKKVTKTYSKGKRNGLWSYKYTIQTYENGSLYNTFNQELTENFTNNIQTGNLIYIKDKNLPMKLKFNKKGALLGNYLLPFGSSEVLIKTNEFGVATEFFDKKDINELAIEVGNKYSLDSITQEEAKELNIEIQKKELIEWFYDANTYNSQPIEDPRGGEDLNGLTFGYLIHSKYDTYLEYEKKKEIKKKNLENFREKFLGYYKLIEKVDKTGDSSYKFNDNDERYHRFQFTDNYIYYKTEFNNSNKPILGNPNKLSITYDFENDKIEFQNAIFNYTINDKTLILESKKFKYIFNKI